LKSEGKIGEENETVDRADDISQVGKSKEEDENDEEVTNTEFIFPFKFFCVVDVFFDIPEKYNCN
jgi:uncharacterized protein YgfB (UPF0149 family)